MRRTEIEIKILNLKNKLVLTDYKAIKYAEGVITLAEYLDTKNQRQAWRDEINRLEKELETYRTNH
jgi:hypothetical protein